LTMKQAIYNQEGEKTGELDLPQDVFGLETNTDLLHQVISVYLSNKRRGTAHTKNRAEVSGGGRKPWRQKGTGRARHGSTRSPIWVGGGVAFGPRKEKKYSRKNPKKMKKKALAVALSAKVKNKQIILIKDLNLEMAKTRILNKIIENLKENIDIFEKGKILILLSQKDENVSRAARNLPGVKVRDAINVNALDILSAKYVLLTQEAIDLIKNKVCLS